MFSSVFLFFEFSAPEIMLILFVTLLLFGGDKLPGLAKGLGKGIREFKDASEGVKREINNQIDNYENKKKEEPAAAPAVEETPLVAEHSTDNVDNAAPDSHVINTMPIGESQVTGTDKVEIETPAKEQHTRETQIPEHENTKHE